MQKRRRERGFRGIAAASLALAIGAITSTAALSAEPAFSDQTAAAGLIFTPSMMTDLVKPELYVGGSVGDFNQDGWPDLFLLGGGLVADALFVNDGDGTFTEEAAAWGIALAHRGQGAIVGDYDGNGWPDIYITSGGDLTDADRTGQHILYRNNADGSFTDVAAAAGVNQTSATFLAHASSAFGDYDLDGDLDLFVTNWAGVDITPDGNRLFRNDGADTFTDVTITAGIVNDFSGFAPRFADMDGDRYPELLIAADFRTSRYYINDTDGTFTDGTVASMTNMDKNGMGAAIADFNRDGLMDWYVTSIHIDPPSFKDGNYLYINLGNHIFDPQTEASGVMDGGWGWGTEALDFDHDGWVDIAETNGWFTMDYPTEPSYLFRNNGNLTFTEVHQSAGFIHTLEGRSLMTLDYDGDGDLDIVITAYDNPVTLFRNDISGSDANWLTVKLDTSADPTLAPDGIGSRLIATTGNVSQYFYLGGGASYLGQSQLIAHFGLGTATAVDELTIEWANGSVSVLTDVPANQRVNAGPPIAGVPGEASRFPVPGQMRPSWNAATGRIDLKYRPACGASNHTIYYGDLADLATYGYSGAACWLGSTGNTSFDPGPLDSIFFLVVGNTGLVEGSYGFASGLLQRPESTGLASCDYPLELAATCP